MQSSVVKAACFSGGCGRPGRVIFSPAFLFGSDVVGPGMTESLEQAVEEDLRIALLVAGQSLREVDESRDENFGFGGGHTRAIFARPPAVDAVQKD